MNPGDGLWKTATLRSNNLQDLCPDPTAQQVGFLGVIEENGKPIELGLRLKLRNGQITETEHLIARNLSERSLANLQTPHSGLLAVVQPAERVPRKQMLNIGASYYEALVTGNGDAAPFADDCVRRENGMQTTGNPPPPTPGRGTLGALGCHDQLNAKMFNYTKRIEPQRIEIADVETGLMFGLSQFRHPMEEKTWKTIGVPDLETLSMDIKPFDRPAAHISKSAAARFTRSRQWDFLCLMIPREAGKVLTESNTVFVAR